MESLSAALEAILFWKAEPVPLKKLATLASTDLASVRAGLDELERSLASGGRGLALVRTDDDAMLGTAPAFSPLIEQLAKDELSRDLGKAGLETLSIVLYQGPISRADIDYIRGVNSQFVLRSLLVRGLVERAEDPSDQRSFLYKPTVSLLAHLGVSSLASMPGYDKVRADIAAMKPQPPAA